MSIELMTLLLFGSMLLVLVMGLPLAFTLSGVGLVFIFIFWGPEGFNSVVQRIWGLFLHPTLAALPLFFFMAMMLERSGIADDLYTAFHKWFGPVNGGLAVGTVLICTMFAAMSGISGAATITMGLIALPAMLARKYDKSLALGSIGAGGVLGILIPPSTTMIVWGIWTRVSIGKMFMGGVFPGLLLSSMYCIYILIRARLNPKLAPALPLEERATWGEKLVSLRAIILPIALVLAVLGSIYMGVATITESAAIGAVGGFICACVYRRISWQILKETCYLTLRLSSFICFILIGGLTFAAIYAYVGAPDFIESLLLGMPGGRWGILILMQSTFLLMGCLLDEVSIIMLTVPAFMPVVRALGFDPLWFGVLFIVNMQVAYLTPPFGFNLFYLKGVAPKELTMLDIYKSVWPFVILQLIGLALVMIFPQIILWLPSMMIGGGA